MYLKSIEVQGFKSFANRIVFEFHSGITAIVGPNGSGKSNVADAVRWVLGEQRSKQLRGASMQDVIFSGTETRKPLGYAFVAITLDNSDHSLNIDYDEVTVARKIYRSGVSEYLMNGKACRLKDVNDLFYDTGIGKEGYSIIGQGQIDRILSGRPEERRELFDEAAGIVRFKKRKAATLKTLADADTRLVRIKDILSELEKQVGPLEKQSAKAREFLDKREELKHYDVNFFLLETERKDGLISSTEEKLKVVNDDLEQHKGRLDAIRREYDQVEETIAALEKEIEEDRGSLNNTGAIRTKLEGQIQVLQESIRAAGANIEHYSERVGQLEELIAEREKEKEGIDSSKSGVDEELAELEKKKDEEKAALVKIQERIEEITNSIEEDKSMIMELIRERGNLRQDKQRYDTMLESIQVRKAELNSRFLQVKTNEEEQKEIIQQLDQEFEAIRQRIEELNYQQQKKEERIAAIHGELSGLDEDLQRVRVAYHEDKTRLEQVSNLTERYEGYGHAVQRVMEKKSEVSGIIGVVADIIKVEKKYETAIETALGGNIQNIVTEDEATAKKLIEFLRNARAGRVTFLPLDALREPQELKAVDALKERGVIGLADEIVETEAAYRDVARNLLGRIIVVDDVDNALKIARKYHYTLRIVTLQGELLVPGGAISGGSFKNNSNLLGRRREMDELEKKVKDAAKKMEEYLDGIEKVKKERNTLRIEVEEIKHEIQEQFLKQNTANLNLQKAREKIEETTHSVDDLNSEQGQIEDQLKEIRDNQHTLSESLKKSTESEKEISERVEKNQQILEDCREEEAEQVMKTTDRQVEYEKVLQRQVYEQGNVNRITEEIGRLKKDLEDAGRIVKESQETIAEKEHNIEEVKKTIEASFASEEESKKELEEKIRKKESLQESRKSFFEQREKLSDQISGLDKEGFRLNEQLEKLKSEVEGLAHYMWMEYEISRQDALGMKDEELTDLSVLRTNINELKESIKRLGTVNVNAIEEYQTVKARYDEMKLQHDDLTQSEEELKKIIDDLDKGMREQFTEKFAEIGKEFDKVFKELFGGGSGTLKLTEEADILEAGIDINAQPPGKKVQNMMVLSGGEKALAAIALLFAIQNLKPSPFCLLDEIEAALDESNVGRYGSYLHKLTKHTQFIVITHRRGTMEKADMLYGITMQEKGVSTRVAVNLIDSQLED